MRLFIRHTTRYRYTDPVVYSIQQLRLTPRADACQQTIRWQLSTPGHPRQQIDAHGNTAHTLVMTQPHQEISLVVEGEIETHDSPMMLPRGTGLSPLAYVSPSALTAPDEAIEDFAASHLAGADRKSCLRLMETIHERVRYQPGITDVTHSASEVLALGQGVCQDQAHLFVASCRARAIPARYVSGYILTDGGHAASHAWADAWIAEENAWLSCDITHAALADGRFCRLAVGRDYLDACPVRGVRNGGNEETMQVSVVVGEEPMALQQAQQ